MVSTIREILDAVKEKVESIESGGQPIISVIDTKPVANPSAYPYAEIVALESVTTERADSGRNYRVVNVRMNVYQDTSEQASGADGYSKIITIADLILTAFDTDKDLSQALYNCLIESSRFDYTTYKQQVVATFNISCAIIIPNV